MLLHLSDDFNLEKIKDSGQCFRWEKTDDHTYRIVHENSCLYISDLGNDQYDLDCTETEFYSVWENYFDLHENYQNIRKKINPETDSFLWTASESQKGIRILRQNPWEMLITFIISQNRNIPAIQKSVKLLSETYGTPAQDSRGLKYFIFPSPEAIALSDEESLNQCRLGYRAKYVRSAAEAVYSQKIDLDSLYQKKEQEVIKELTKLYGIGPKVANCISLFGLHHTDAFPKDVWINRILEKKYPDGYPFSQYSPYNGIFQQYLFAYYRSHPDA